MDSGCLTPQKKNRLPRPAKYHPCPATHRENSQNVVNIMVDYVLLRMVIGGFWGLRVVINGFRWLRGVMGGYGLVMGGYKGLVVVTDGYGWLGVVSGRYEWLNGVHVVSQIIE